MEALFIGFGLKGHAILSLFGGGRRASDVQDTYVGYSYRRTRGGDDPVHMTGRAIYALRFPR